MHFSETHYKLTVFKMCYSVTGTYSSIRWEFDAVQAWVKRAGLYLCICNFFPWTKQPTEGRVDFGSQNEECGGVAMEEKHEAADHIESAAWKQRSVGADAQIGFSPSFILLPQPMGWHRPRSGRLLLLS